MKYLSIGIIIFSCLLCSCLKKSSTTSAVSGDTEILYTTGKVEEGFCNEIILIPKIVDLLSIGSSQEFLDRLYKSMSKDELLNTVKQKVESLSDSTTLYWFHVGHGHIEGSNYFFSTSEYNVYLTIDEIMSAIKEVRKTPIKRLVIFSTICHAGELFKNIKNYKDIVFKETLVYTSSSNEETMDGRGNPALYSALYFLNLARQNMDASVEELAEETNKSLESLTGIERYKRFSKNDLKQCPLIRFNTTSNFNAVSVGNISRESECKYEKEPVIISNRSKPTYQDMYDLVNYLVVNEDNPIDPGSRYLNEKELLQLPFLYTYPDKLRLEAIWK